MIRSSTWGIMIRVRMRRRIRRWKKRPMMKHMTMPVTGKRLIVGHCQPPSWPWAGSCSSILWKFSSGCVVAPLAVLWEKKSSFWEIKQNFFSNSHSHLSFFAMLKIVSRQYCYDPKLIKFTWFFPFQSPLCRRLVSPTLNDTSCSFSAHFIWNKFTLVKAYNFLSSKIPG